MKKCSTCCNVLDKSFFYKNKKQFDGLHNQCKSCHKQSGYKSRIKYNRSEKGKDWRKEYQKTKQYREYKRDYEFNKYQNDVCFRLKHILRSRFRLALKNNQKTGSAVKDLGCSITELKQYLEAQFQSGMTWDNHGEWHIDHIIPLASFNLMDKQQILKACHYTNLRPLWANENFKRNQRIKLDI